MNTSVLASQDFHHSCHSSNILVRICKNRMLADATEVHRLDGIDHLVNTVASSDSAIGEEAAGFFDADLSLT